MAVKLLKPPHGPTGAELRFLQQELAQISSDLGIALTVSQPTWGDWRTHVGELSKEEAARVVYVPGGWLPELAGRGLIVNMTERFPKRVGHWSRAYPESVYQQGCVNGQQYGIPVYGAVWCFMYNGRLLTDCGLPGGPRTWNELMDCARKLKQRAPEICPYGIHDDSDGHFIDHGYVYLLSGGKTEWRDGSGKLRLLNPGAVQGLAFLRSMVEQGLANPPDRFPSDKVMEQFFSGRIAMTVGPSDWVLEQRVREPDFPLRVSLMPCPDGGEPLSVASYGFYCIMADGFTEEAAMLIDSLIRPERLAKHIRTIGMLPVQKSMNLYEDDKEMRVFAEQVCLSGSLPVLETDMTNKLTREMLACLRLEKSAAAALRDADTFLREKEKTK